MLTPAAPPSPAVSQVRDNILFGAPYEAERFNRVVEACQLLPDLAQLGFGELTPIGDKGVALSGGQRSRVALARAVYADAEVYLLDDPLSACDPAVSAQLVEKVLGPRGLLKDKLRVLVSSALEPLPGADAIYVLEEGAVSECGTFASLAAANGAFARQLQLSRDQMAGAASLAAAADAQQPPTHAPVHHAPPAAAAAEASAHFTEGGAGSVLAAEKAAAGEEVAEADSTGEGEEEEGAAVSSATATAEVSPSSDDEDDGRVTGAVRLQTLSRWVSAAGGRRAVLLALVPLVLAELVSLGSSWWLTRWAAAPAAAQVA